MEEEEEEEEEEEGKKARTLLPRQRWAGWAAFMAFGWQLCLAERRPE